ncbi:gamma-butyrobetaine dioxygenase-like [Topomyia yanbarensis]|uniref:gamma-butyrobetaine dioxygenase-like n=1 Tax=Topomyia yanbarensis TaxID=2498891 RepID=UPI00273BBE7A|nr:gamma-butyrobetaine dioxygenase-like [Topomyia yanbarensis]
MALRILSSRIVRQTGVSLFKVEQVIDFGMHNFKQFILSKSHWNPTTNASVSLHHAQSGSWKAASASEPHLVDSNRGSKIVASYQPEATRERHHLIVESADEQRFEFPLIWLRDNCQCAECFHPKSYSRILNWELFKVDAVAQLREIVLTENGNKLEIIWSDGHRSQYGSEWLLKRSFDNDSKQEYLNEWYRPRPTLWNKHRFGEILENFEFKDVINSDEALLAWIECLIKYGVVMIRNTPLAETEARKLVERVGFIRKTHYGEEYIIKAKEGTSNVAYLSAPLQMHTDLPYYDYLPGCNLLHCLVQSESQGGRNLLCDAFYVAELMREKHPKEFKILSETLVNWTDVGEDEGREFHSIYRAPVICIGRDGNLERINHSVPQRDSFFNVPLASVEPWYRALELFVGLIHREAVQFKTVPGNILTFSNVRMLHGRSGYTDTVANTRHIVGAFLDWDEIYSKWRVLKAKTKK